MRPRSSRTGTQGPQRLRRPPHRITKEPDRRGNERRADHNRTDDPAGAVGALLMRHLWESPSTAPDGRDPRVFFVSEQRRTPPGHGGAFSPPVIGPDQAWHWRVDRVCGMEGREHAQVAVRSERSHRYSTGLSRRELFLTVVAIAVLQIFALIATASNDDGLLPPLMGFAATAVLLWHRARLPAVVGAVGVLSVAALVLSPM